MKDSIFSKYYKKIKAEGLLKSFLLALTIALFVETVILLAFWFVGIKRYWLSAGISVGICAALVPSLYFLFFRPENGAKTIVNRPRVVIYLFRQNSTNLWRAYFYAVFGRSKRNVLRG